jgi:hypothetical protein
VPFGVCLEDTSDFLEDFVIQKSESLLELD